MPCMPFNINGITGWACSIGEHDEPRCYKCGAPAKYACDHRKLHYLPIAWNPLKGEYSWSREPVAELHTCNKQMCEKCTNRKPGGLDFCDEHNNELSITETRKAEKVLELMKKSVDEDEGRSRR